jgi:hypothetical protein
MRILSVFENVQSNIPTGPIEFETYLENVKNGVWKSDVESVRNGERMKTSLPCITISGVFTKRNNECLVEHSGIIAIDIDYLGDHLDVSKLVNDQYLYAIHRSVGGMGYVAYFLIDPNKHAESFRGLQHYLLSLYGLSIDKACKDVARLRIVSYDPELLIAAAEPPIFDKFIVEPENQIDDTIVQSTNNYPPPTLQQLRSIAEYLVKESIDITKQFDDWIRIGYAIAHHYGEEGRASYIMISSLHPKFNEHEVHKEYDYMLKKNDGRTSIGSLFHTLKEYEIRANDILQHTTNIQEIEIEHDGIIDETDSQIIEFLQEKGIIRNLVLNRIEYDGRIIEDADVNSLFMECKQYIKSKRKEQKSKKHKSKSISKHMFLTAMESKFIPEYNPFDDFVASLPEIEGRSHLDALLSCLTYDEPEAKIFVEKWLVGLLASLQGIHIVTILVLVGKQNIGKTTFFRHLLPDQLKRYFADAKVDEGKDYMALLASNIIVCDDEFSGKSKSQVVALKRIASQDLMTFREPYGRYNVTRKRYALLCATTNDEYVLSDMTGNRRLLPINIEGIDIDKLKNIDKIKLFSELKNLSKTSDNYILSQSDIDLLNTLSIVNYEPQMEEEFVMIYLRKPDSSTPQHEIKQMTNSEILQYFYQKTNFILHWKKLGMALKRNGYVKVTKTVDKKSRGIYHVVLQSNIEDRRWEDCNYG